MPNTHRRRDSTQQLRLVGVGGVYWALHLTILLVSELFLYCISLVYVCLVFSPGTLPSLMKLIDTYRVGQKK